MSLLYLVLSDVSICYPSLRGKFFTRYSPVRHDTFYRSRSSHRLACVKHSVSVHPEPGSNSSFNIYFHYLNLFFLGVCFFFYFHCPFCQRIFVVDKEYIIKSHWLCQRFFSIFLCFFRLSSQTLYCQGFFLDNFFEIYDLQYRFFTADTINYLKNFCILKILIIFIWFFRSENQCSISFIFW